MRKFTKEQSRQIAAVATKKDADIDVSEMPEVVNWSGAEMGRFYRPPKKPVTMQLDQDVVDWLKSYGRAIRHGSMLCCGTRWTARTRLRRRGGSRHRRRRLNRYGLWL
jgi:uncharacterized protein (DUF4415 family)